MFNSSTNAIDTRTESVGVAVLLAVCGGFLDAFTYMGPHHVFANAMTGNVVLLGAAAARGRWHESLVYLHPIISFLLGVSLAQVFRLPSFPKRTPNGVLACLTLEILFLMIGGGFPKNSGANVLVNGISFVAAFQSCTFQKARKWSYNSTMTTGNLRSFGEAMFQVLFGTRDAESAEKARIFGTICLCFAGGAVFGGLCTVHLHNRALWVVGFLLVLLWLFLFAGFRPLLRGERAGT